MYYFLFSGYSVVLDILSELLTKISHNNNSVRAYRYAVLIINFIIIMLKLQPLQIEYPYSTVVLIGVLTTGTGFLSSNWQTDQLISFT